MSRENNHADIRAKLQYFLTTKKIPNIIFHGESLSGKRGLLNEFLHHIYQGDRVKMKSHVMTVECCHGKGIKFIREELKFFAKAHIQSNHGANFKSIVLLNADSLTIDAQSALRRCIELFSHNTRFFILVENKERLLNPILSRFCEIYVATGNDGEPVVPPNVVAAYQDVTQSITRELPHACGATLVHSAVQWCEDGWSANDWLAASEANAAQGHMPLHHHIAMAFHRIKPDFRCEKMLMFYLLYFTFVSSKSDLENMLL